MAGRWMFLRRTVTVRCMAGKRIPTSWPAIMAALAAGCVLAGCGSLTQPLAVALAGAGTSTAIGHSLGGTAYRTFSHPMEEVKAATLDTLALMGIRVDRFSTLDTGEVVYGTAYRRTVEVELEPISAKATRIRVVTRNGGFFHDAATATEIVLQTEKTLGVYEVTNSSTGASRRVKR